MSLRCYVQAADDYGQTSYSLYVTWGKAQPFVFGCGRHVRKRQPYNTLTVCILCHSPSQFLSVKTSTHSAIQSLRSWTIGYVFSVCSENSLRVLTIQAWAALCAVCTRGGGLCTGNISRGKILAGGFRRPWESPSSNTCNTLRTPLNFATFLEDEIFSRNYPPAKSPPPPCRPFVGTPTLCTCVDTVQTCRHSAHTSV